MQEMFNLHEDVQEIMFTKQEINSIIYTMADKINTDFAGKEIIAVVILKGSLMFASDLIRALSVNVKLDFIQVSSYGASTVSSGNVILKKDLDEDISGKNVLLIEDIIDSGNTLSHLREHLINRGAKSVKIASLLSKPSRREIDVQVEYIGAEIPDKFVVGYGLDYNEKYRQLDYIGILKPSVYEK